MSEMSACLLRYIAEHRKTDGIKKKKGTITTSAVKI